MDEQPVGGTQSPLLFWPQVYSQFDKKFDSIERDFRSEINTIRSEINTIRTEIGNLGQSLLGKIGEPRHSSNPFQLILTSLAIVTALGAAGSYVSTQLAGNITDLKMQLAKEERERIDDERGELRARTDADLRIFDTMKNLWTKDAQVEYERRIDERDAREFTLLIRDVDRLDKQNDSILANMVPRKEHDQRWATESQEIERERADRQESTNRLAEHVNQSDQRTEARFLDMEKTIHGYGLADEVKSLEQKVQDLTTKLFNTLSLPPLTVAPQKSGGSEQ